MRLGYVKVQGSGILGQRYTLGVRLGYVKVNIRFRVTVTVQTIKDNDILLGVRLGYVKVKVRHSLAGSDNSGQNIL